MSRRNNIIRLYPWELESMPEYSATLPSGHVLFKMWKCATYDRRTGNPLGWQVGQYIPCSIPGTIGIRWFIVVLRQGPEPRRWKTPDWDNSARYRREGFYRNPCVCGSDNLVGEPPKCRGCGRRYAA